MILSLYTNVWACNINHVFSVCPTGYEAKVGDVEGGGLVGGYSASLEKCKSDCDDSSNCFSFVHYMGGNHCKLLAEAELNYPKYKDGQFCKNLVKGKFYYYWHVWRLLYHWLNNYAKYAQICLK